MTSIWLFVMNGWCRSIIFQCTLSIRKFHKHNLKGLWKSTYFGSSHDGCQTLSEKVDPTKRTKTISAVIYTRVSSQLPSSVDQDKLEQALIHSKRKPTWNLEVIGSIVEIILMSDIAKICSATEFVIHHKLQSCELYGSFWYDQRWHGHFDTK